jgi:hypothetical protein
MLSTHTPFAISLYDKLRSKPGVHCSSNNVPKGPHEGSLLVHSFIPQISPVELVTKHEHPTSTRKKKRKLSTMSSSFKENGVSSLYRISGQKRSTRAI